MLIGGLQKLSLLDYPDKLSAIIFTSGCNFRCPYCYNPELVTKINKQNLLSEKEIMAFLASRTNKLEAVVITGGEPTLHADLPAFIKKVKTLGFLIKLDSNGTNPEMLKKIIQAGLVDYLAMDIKAPLDKYSKVVRVPVNIKNIKHSIQLIMNSGLDYEFRSTILPTLHSYQDIEAMAKLIRGAKKYFLQNFVPSGRLNDDTFNKLKGFTSQQMDELIKLCQPYVEQCAAR